MNGLAIFIRNGVGFKAHRFVAYAAEQATSVAPLDVRKFAKLHPPRFPLAKHRALLVGRTFKGGFSTKRSKTPYKSSYSYLLERLRLTGCSFLTSGPWHLKRAIISYGILCRNDQAKHDLSLAIKQTLSLIPASE